MKGAKGARVGEQTNWQKEDSVVKSEQQVGTVMASAGRITA